MPAPKLTEEQVIEIRMSREPGMKLAEMYGVSQSTISNVKAGRTWLDTAGPIRRRRRAKLNEGDIRDIRENKEGITQSEIARRLGVVQSTISHVVNQRTWKGVF